MILTKIQIAEIAAKIVENLRPEKVVLFGSYAEGCATEDSDLDLLVIMKGDGPRYRRSAAIRHLFWPPIAPMDILVYTPEEVERWNGTPNHILTDAHRHGKVLYAA